MSTRSSRKRWFPGDRPWPRTQRQLTHAGILTSIGCMDIAEVITGRPFITIVIGMTYFAYAVLIYFEEGEPPIGGTPVAA